MGIITAGPNNFASEWATNINAAFEGLIKVQSLDGSVVFVDEWDDLLNTLTLATGDTVTVYPGEYTATQNTSGDTGFVDIDDLTIIGIGRPTITCTIIGAVPSQAGFKFVGGINLYMKGLALRTITDVSYTGVGDTYNLFITGYVAGLQVSGNLVEDCNLTQIINAAANGSENIVTIQSEEVVYKNCTIATLNLAPATNVNYISTHDALAASFIGCAFAKSGAVGLRTGTITPKFSKCTDSSGIINDASPIGYEEALQSIHPLDRALFDSSDCIVPDKYDPMTFEGTTGGEVILAGGPTYSFADSTSNSAYFYAKAQRSTSAGSTLNIRLNILWNTATAGEVAFKVVTYQYPRDGSVRTTGGSSIVTASALGTALRMTTLEIDVTNSVGTEGTHKLTVIIQRVGSDAGDTFPEIAYIFTPEYKWVD